ncbi:glucose 1,6-bisphosphate synthase-like [Onthophagus taurus]|uniref:glucose 1,6-bisphosphate synthase-like n=1 Tax=Onthophagus taurus TaxID=166361 RepID=UPI000C200BDE|nr:glucose 1,6-bisphosphate synthase-like [Onthophagus taurus]
MRDKSERYVDDCKKKEESIHENENPEPSVAPKPQPIRVKMTSGDPVLDAHIREWLAWDKNKTTLEQIKHLVRHNEFNQLRLMFMNRLQYSIYGFKGHMEAGYNAMNDIFVVQCGQGLLRYLETNEWKKLKSAGIVIGHDARHNSKRFAELIATIFVQKNYPVKLFNVVVPRILVVKAIIKYSSAAGVMVGLSTGSSNENGLQIFDSFGVQFVHPIESELEDCIRNSLEPQSLSWETTILSNSELRTNPLADVLKEYLDSISEYAMHDYREINKKSLLKFTYTALHGVGFIYMARALDILHVHLVPVETEKYPLPDFSSSSVPDFRGEIRLHRAVQVAKEQHSDYIIANNSDCSRVVIAERRPNTNEYKFFNADEIALLLAWWNYHIYQDNVHTQREASNLFMVGNIFNTKLIKHMARIDGFYFMETFGGKWLGHTVKQLMDQERPVIFAYDGYGYIVNPLSFTNDGLGAGAQLATLVNYLNHHHITLEDHLEDMYKQYGYYTSLKFYFTTESVEETNEIYNRMRYHKDVQEYPKSMGNGKYVIRFIRDLANKLDTAEENKRTTLPEDPNVELLSFKFDNNTETTLYNYKLTPLYLKLHTSIWGPGNTPEEQEQLRTNLNDTTNVFINEFLETLKHQLSKNMGK